MSRQAKQGALPPAVVGRVEMAVEWPATVADPENWQSGVPWANDSPPQASKRTASRKAFNVCLMDTSLGQDGQERGKKWGLPARLAP